MTRLEEQIWDEYLDWLLRYVNFKKKGYHRLMRYLHNIDFVWVIERDRNRADDGLNLRRMWQEKVSDRTVQLIFSRPCSVLEMLVGLADRIENEYIGDPSNPHPEEIFWEMLCNLGLDRCVDRGFDEVFLEKILMNWMLRRFDFDGNGSIFPLFEAEFDQRELLIWSQMQQYLSEKY